MRTVLKGLRPTVEHEGEFVVIGLGRFGSSLATALIDMGHEVLGVDADPERVASHADLLTHVAEADTVSETALRQLGVKDAITVAVCIGSDLEASILTTAAIADLGVPNIWAKAVTAAHAESATVLGPNDLIVLAGHRADIERFSTIDS